MRTKISSSYKFVFSAFPLLRSQLEFLDFPRLSVSSCLTQPRQPALSFQASPTEPKGGQQLIYLNIPGLKNTQALFTLLQTSCYSFVSFVLGKKKPLAQAGFLEVIPPKLLL